MWIVYTERPVALVLAYDTFYSLAAQEFEAFGKDPGMLEKFPGAYPKLIYIELPANDIQADIINLRSQFIGDPLYIQTDRYQAFPPSVDEIGAVFRREVAVRENVDESLLNELDKSCLLSKFISALKAGYVCFDPEGKTLSGFYENEYLRE